MANTEQNEIELHGDEEIIDVIELEDTEPGPGGLETVNPQFLPNTHTLAAPTLSSRSWKCV